MGGKEGKGRNALPASVLPAKELMDRYQSMADGYRGEAPTSYVWGLQTKANELKRLLLVDPEAAEIMAAELQKPLAETHEAVKKTMQ